MGFLARCNYPKCENTDVRLVIEADVRTDRKEPPELIQLCGFHRGIRQEIIDNTVRYPRSRPLPIAPLRNLLRRYVAAFGYDVIERLISPSNVNPHDLHRLLNVYDVVRRGAADVYCYRLGTHPAALWPDEWLDAHLEANCKPWRYAA